MNNDINKYSCLLLCTIHDICHLPLWGEDKDNLFPVIL